MPFRHRVARAARAASLVVVAFAATAAASAQETPLARGRYLVTTVMACGNCHTPKDDAGRPIAGRELAGGGITIDIPPFAATAPNITPDRETGIGGWSDAEIARAITHGERPARGALAGRPLVVMASNFFKALVPRDIEAIVAYLRSLPPISNTVAAPTLRAPPMPAEGFALADRGFRDDELRDPVRRGAYLATIAHCLECHTPIDDKGVLQFATSLGAGGRPFLPSFIRGLPASWQGAVSRNITSHREQGLGAWSDAEIRRAIAQGVGRDGRTLAAPMPYAWYAGIRADDLDAIVAYLRTLPPLPR